MAAMQNKTTHPERIHVVIPVLNRWPQTEACIESLRSSDHNNLEIIVVDHGSTDETAQALREFYPEITRIEADASLWWAGATNVGVREALRRGAQNIFLLNNDCIVTHTTIAVLVAHARKCKDGVISAVQIGTKSNRILNYPVTSCLLLGFTTLMLPRIVLKYRTSRLQSTRLIVGGRGVVIPATVFENVGLFDEQNLPHYGADHDFYLRCRKRGVLLYVSTDATVYVDESRSSIASNLGLLNFRQFLDSFTNRRSHRNIRDLDKLFKMHYPIRWLYRVGVGLNLLRYTIAYMWKRLRIVVLSKGAAEKI